MTIDEFLNMIETMLQHLDEQVSCGKVSAHESINVRRGLIILRSYVDYFEACINHFVKDTKDYYGLFLWTLKVGA